MPTGSPFRLQYFPYELWSFFIQAPQRIAAYPYLAPSISGVALTWTSPALVLAFFARKPVRWVVALWVAAALCAAPNFVYYVNGFAQFGMRHALDFEPFLVALIFLAARERLPRWGMALMAYSMVVGFWGVWFWNSFVRTN
jgi:triacylglycerol esterase/lipase EstA (alpha/beta hydrolase family)